MTDRPHQFPHSAIGEEIIAWKCVACDQWISEYADNGPDECPVDWRRAS